MSLSSSFRITLVLLLVLPFSLKAKEPLYWEAQKGEQTLLIFGSIHVGDNSMYPLPKVVLESLQLGRGLIVELDVSQPTSPIHFPDSKLKSIDVLEENQKKHLVEIADSLGLPSSTLLSSPPWLAAITLQMSNFQRLGYDPQQGIDHVMVTKAKQQDKTLLPLESVEQQLGFLNNLPNNGERLLTETLGQWDASSDEFHCLINAWKSGDKVRLKQLLQDGEFDENMLEILLYKRNQDWENQINSGNLMASEGTYTMVVGTLHLLGKDSVIELLEKSGWEVRQISKSSPSTC